MIQQKKGQGRKEIQRGSYKGSKGCNNWRIAWQDCRCERDNRFDRSCKRCKNRGRENCRSNECCNRPKELELSLWDLSNYESVLHYWNADARFCLCRRCRLTTVKTKTNCTNCWPTPRSERRCCAFVWAERCGCSLFWERRINITTLCLFLLSIQTILIRVYIAATA